MRPSIIFFVCAAGGASASPFHLNRLVASKSSRDISLWSRAPHDIRSLTHEKRQSGFDDSFFKNFLSGGGDIPSSGVECSVSGGGSASASSSSGGSCNKGSSGSSPPPVISGEQPSPSIPAGIPQNEIPEFPTEMPAETPGESNPGSGNDCTASGTGSVSATNINGQCTTSNRKRRDITPPGEIPLMPSTTEGGSGTGSGSGPATGGTQGCTKEIGAAGSQPQCSSSRIKARQALQGQVQSQPQPQPTFTSGVGAAKGGSDYLSTVNRIRTSFCLPPYTLNPELEANAATQGAVTQGVPESGYMKEDPCPGSAQVMAGGTGASSIELAMKIWACEVPTSNIDGCTCAQAWSDYRFQWTERGHFDLLVGPQAADYTQIGCAFTPLTATGVNVPASLHGLWTCTLGNEGYRNCKSGN